MRQLRRDGTWGKPDTFGFVLGKDVIALCERLPQDADVRLTIGLSFRRPTTNDKRMSPSELSRQMRDTLKNHYFYDVRDDGETISVTALSDNDLY